MDKSRYNLNRPDMAKAVDANGNQLNLIRKRDAWKMTGWSYSKFSKLSKKLKKYVNCQRLVAYDVDELQKLIDDENNKNSNEDSNINIWQSASNYDITGINQWALSD